MKTKIKKIFAVTLALLMISACMSLTAFAKTETLSADVYVTISVKGELAVTLEKITVTDIDGDSTLTINDALYAAHESKYEGGAKAGFASAYGDYGLSLTKLWGDTSGNFGYYLNNASAWSLTDAVKDGDYVKAFIYSDTEFYSDTYSYFDKNTASVDAGEALTLTLSAAGYDENWNPITVAVADAVITVDGEKTDYKTDANGKAVIEIADGGEHIISAVAENMTLVPPVCVVAVKGAETSSATKTSTTVSNDTTANETTASEDVNDDVDTGVSKEIFVYFMLASVAFVTVILSAKRKNAVQK